MVPIFMAVACLSITSTAAVNELARKLAGVPVTVEVLDTDEPRAGALPGGYLLLSSGMIIGKRTEAELAAVMAHQIAHLVARHGKMRGGRMPGTYIGTGWGVCSRYNPDAKGLIPLSWQSHYAYGRTRPTISRAGMWTGRTCQRISPGSRRSRLGCRRPLARRRRA